MPEPDLESPPSVPGLTPLCKFLRDGDRKAAVVDHRAACQYIGIRQLPVRKVEAGRSSLQQAAIEVHGVIIQAVSVIDNLGGGERSAIEVQDVGDSGTIDNSRSSHIEDRDVRISAAADVDGRACGVSIVKVSIFAAKRKGKDSAAEIHRAAAGARLESQVHRRYGGNEAAGLVKNSGRGADGIADIEISTNRKRAAADGQTVPADEYPTLTSPVEPVVICPPARTSNPLPTKTEPSLLFTTAQAGMASVPMETVKALR